MIKESLTGKTRYRVQKKIFGYYLVLQVEVRAEGVHYSDNDIYGKKIYKKYWRDATIEDVCDKNI